MNYTPLNIDHAKKQHTVRSKSTILFVIIAILSFVVMGLLIYIMMQNSV